MKVNKYNNIEKIANILKEKDIILDFTNLNNKDRIRVLDFISGLTFYNGKMKKIDKNTFEIILGR